MKIEEMRMIKQQIGYTNEMISQESGIALGTVQKIFAGVTKNPRRQTIEDLQAFFLSKLDPYRQPLDFSETESVLQESVSEAGSRYAGSSGAKGYTVSDYYALPDGQRAELIDGVFYDMSAPAYVHQQIIEEIVFQISSYIRKKHGMCQIVPSPVDVRLDRDERTMVQPDAVVVCGDHKDRIRKWGIMGAPDFVLEVLSPRTRRKDLHLKCTKYLSAGVREYWILDPDKRKLLIWRGEESLPELFELSGKVELSVFDEPMMVDLDMVQQLINQNELLEE